MYFPRSNVRSNVRSQSIYTVVRSNVRFLNFRSNVRSSVKSNVRFFNVNSIKLASRHSEHILIKMKCLYGKPSAQSTTQNGSFWFCNQNPSCNLICSKDESYTYEKATAAWKIHAITSNGCPKNLITMLNSPNQKSSKMKNTKNNTQQRILSTISLT